MDIKEILTYVDHTLLLQTASEADIARLCEEGVKYGVASVCIPPCYVKFAKSCADKLPVCTVVGFPNGYNSAEVKVSEAAWCLNDGADEIDMVINIAMLKSGRHDAVLDEIKAVKKAVGDKILKVIIETCLLTEQEKIAMCNIVSESGADFIKTSTGFSTGGATFGDVALFKKHVAEHVAIKAAGGISSLEDAVSFIELGASRLGTSRIVKLANNQSGEGY